MPINKSDFIPEFVPRSRLEPRIDLSSTRVPMAQVFHNPVAPVGGDFADYSIDVTNLKNPSTPNISPTGTIETATIRGTKGEHVKVTFTDASGEHVEGVVAIPKNGVGKLKFNLPGDGTVGFSDTTPETPAHFSTQLKATVPMGPLVKAKSTTQTVTDPGIYNYENGGATIIGPGEEYDYLQIPDAAGKLRGHIGTITLKYYGPNQLQRESSSPIPNHVFVAGAKVGNATGTLSTDENTLSISGVEFGSETHVKLIGGPGVPGVDPRKGGANWYLDSITYVVGNTTHIRRFAR